MTSATTPNIVAPKAGHNLKGARLDASCTPYHAYDKNLEPKSLVTGLEHEPKLSQHKCNNGARNRSPDLLRYRGLSSRIDCFLTVQLRLGYTMCLELDMDRFQMRLEQLANSFSEGIP